MKYLKIITLSFTFALFSILNGQTQKIEIVATGLTCSLCSNAINKQLKTIEGVADVNIDLNTNSFIVETKEGFKVAPSLLKESIEKAGFFVGSMIIEFNSDVHDTDFKFIDDEPKNASKAQIINEGYVTKKSFKKFYRKYGNVLTNDSTYYVIEVVE